MIELPPGALTAADAIAKAGFVVFIVGGAVRDALMGRPVHEVDLATSATPEEVRSILARMPEVEAQWNVGERFGTVGATVAGTDIEITLLRGEREAARSSALDRFASDAAHRDLTVNAIGIAHPDGALLDPWGGRSDVEARMLRAVGDPLERMTEDPLRVLRVARFVSELDFDVEVATYDALVVQAPLLREVAPERIRSELTRLLVGARPDRGLALIQESGALAIVVPEVAELVGMDQPSFHHLDGFEHTSASVVAAPRDPVLRWAALLHDVGKPPTRTVEHDGRVRFFRHADVGASIAEQVCVRLRFSKADRKRIVHLVERHMRFSELDIDNPRAVDRAVRRMDLWDEDDAPPRPLVTAEDAIELVAADMAATTAAARAPAVRRRLLHAVAESRARGVSGRAVSPVDGHEIMRLLGVAEGPEVGRLKDAVSDAVADGRLAVDDREGALELARRLHSGNSERRSSGGGDVDPSENAPNG